MKYKILQNDKYGIDNIQEMILSNRGIDNPEGYLNVSEKDIIHYSKLNNIKDAANVIIDAVENGLKFGLVCDSDADGAISSSIFYQYMKVALNVDCKYYIHDSKEHGLSKDILPIIISDIKNKNIEILIVVDAGTNDIEQCKQIKSLGCDVVIADHHEQENQNSYAYIVNPMISSDYKNKYLSGSATVYKLIQQIDDINWTVFAENYLDLVAVSLISDSMDIRTFENRQLLNIGLSNIKNKFLLSLLDKVSYSTKDEITPITIGYYCSPLINGLIRSGTTEEKEMMFKAFCQIDEEFDYTKRDKTEIKESIYERVARLAVNAKSRQDRAVEKGIEIIEADIELNNRNKNKILFALATDDLDRAFSGLIAMKLANKYNKPVALLRDNGKDYFSGSIRNFNGSPLTDLKSFLLSLNSVQWIQGHANAAGISMTKKQLLRLINLSNEKLANYDFSPIYSIDLEYNQNNISTLTNKTLNKIYELRNYYGQTISETLILLKGITINSSEIKFIGKEKKDSWKFSLENSNIGSDININVEVIKFKFDENDIISDRFQSENFSWDGVDIVLDLIVKVSKNDFNGNNIWSFSVQEYEIVE